MKENLYLCSAKKGVCFSMFFAPGIVSLTYYFIEIEESKTECSPKG